MYLLSILCQKYICVMVIDSSHFIPFHALNVAAPAFPKWFELEPMHFLSQNGKGRIPAESKEQNQHDQHRRKMSERIIKNIWLRCASVLYIVICYVRVHSQWNKWAVLLCVRRPLTPTHAYIHTFFICSYVSIDCDKFSGSLLLLRSLVHSNITKIWIGSTVIRHKYDIHYDGLYVYIM